MRRLPRSLETTQLLLDMGADVDARTAKDNPVLALAATSSQLRRQGEKTAFFRRLVAAGADVDDWRVLEGPFRRSTEPELLQVFIDAGFACDPRTAAALGETDTLRAWFDTDSGLTRGTDWLPDALPDSLRTHRCALDLALTYAAYWGHVGTLAWLVERGAAVNARPPGFYWPGEKGSTALHKAADAGRLDVARWLLAHGADPRCPISRGTTCRGSGPGTGDTTRCRT